MDRRRALCSCAFDPRRGHPAQGGRRLGVAAWLRTLGRRRVGGLESWKVGEVMRLWPREVLSEGYLRSPLKTWRQACIVCSIDDAEVLD